MSLTLAQGQSIATMLAVAAVAILLAGAFYRRAFGTLPPRRFAALLGLRAAAILLVVTLLFRPVLSYQDSPAERPALIFLLDTSASMSIADDAAGTPRFNQARDKLSKWCEKLKGDFRLRLIAFAEQADTLEGPHSLAGLTPTGQATSLSRALAAASRQFAPNEVAAVVLLSDGIDNFAGNPIEAARKTGLTVHTIGVGASLRDNPSYRDIQVTGIDCPDHMLLNNIAKVTGSIDAVGLGGRVIQPILEEDDKQVAQAELTLDDAEGSQQVTFEFRPTTKGRHTYTVRVEPVEGEKIVENNQRSAVATVTEAGIRVLYIEGTLRAEYGALVDRFLAKDPDLEFCALVQTRPNVFLRRTNMSDLRLAAIPKDQQTIDRFDVFIFGDIDSTYLRPEQQQMFVKRIRAGAGAVMLGGYHSLGPGGYAGTPLGEVLPLKLGGREIGQYTDSFLPLLTPDGSHHPIFANIAGFFPTRQGDAKQPGLPPLDGCTRVEAARPGATVLATLPAQGSEMPVLAVQPVDRGRAAVFAADTTRKWQQGPRALGRDSPFLRFWGQMVRWLAGRAESLATQAGIDASADKTVYQPGETIHLAAVVRNRDGQGAEGAKVEAVVKGPLADTDHVPLAAVPGPSGHYAGVFEPRLAGRYDVVVAARLDQLAFTSEKISVEVGRPNLEFERLDLDEKTLAAIAAATGGRYVSLSAADHFIDQLNRSKHKKTVTVETQLYWPPAVWTLFVAIITAEWTMRRRYQLR
ncbi:MAG: VWA domain-containing protein [Thermoguttaceae bacterium]